MPARPCSHAPEHLPERARALSLRAHGVRAPRLLGEGPSVEAVAWCSWGLSYGINMQHAPFKRNIHGSVPQVQISRVTRSVLADEPRVTRFQIKWDEMEQEAMPEPDTLMPSELEVPMVM